MDVRGMVGTERVAEIETRINELARRRDALQEERRELRAARPTARAAVAARGEATWRGEDPGEATDAASRMAEVDQELADIDAALEVGRKELEAAKREAEETARQSLAPVFEGYARELAERLAQFAALSTEWRDLKNRLEMAGILRANPYLPGFNLERYNIGDAQSWVRMYLGEVDAMFESIDADDVVKRAARDASKFAREVEP